MRNHLNQLQMQMKRLLSLFTMCLILAGCQKAPEVLPELAIGAKPMDPGYMRGINISHYLSQLGSQFTFGDTDYVSEKDFVWLRQEGFDHIRLPVDGPLLLGEDGSIKTDMFGQIDRTIEWANRNGLNVLLDMHKLPGSSFSGDPDSRLFENPELEEIAGKLWKFIALRYRERGPELRFEILNEPVSADAALVTAFYGRMIKLIRGISPDRVIHVCSNRWGRIETIDALLPLFPDPDLVVDIHYYDPHIFTHQKASWVQSDHPDFPEIEFPGVVPDLSDVIPENHYGHSYIGRELTVDQIAQDFQILADWSGKHNIRVYNGEFGVYYKAPDQSRTNWYRAVLNQCRKHGIGWAAWDYKGGFGIREADTGKPTLVHHAIKPYLQQ